MIIAIHTMKISQKTSTPKKKNPPTTAHRSFGSTNSANTTRSTYSTSRSASEKSNEYAEKRFTNAQERSIRQTFLSHSKTYSVPYEGE
jgi:hypothetical protein